MWICETKVAISCLMLVSDTTSAICDNKEDTIVISSSCWDLAVSFFTLLERLNENWSWKVSMTLEPRVSSGLREEKDGRFHVTCCMSLQGDLWWNFSGNQWVNWSSEEVAWSMCLEHLLCQDCWQWTSFIFIFSLLFYFFFSFLFYFLFLEQLRLGVISHAVTSVTTWWRSHKTDHGRMK